MIFNNVKVAMGGVIPTINWTRFFTYSISLISILFPFPNPF